MSRLGRGRVSEDIKDRIRPERNEPGWSEQFEQPALCVRCDDWFNLPDAVQVVRERGVTAITHYVCSQECADRSWCNTNAGIHTEVYDMDDERDVYQAMTAALGADKMGDFTERRATFQRMLRIISSDTLERSQLGCCSRCGAPFVWSPAEQRWVDLPATVKLHELGYR